MSAAEKTLAEKVADAWNAILGENSYAKDLSDRDLIELSNVLWAVQVDLQNEWVRRKMASE